MIRIALAGRLRSRRYAQTAKITIINMKNISEIEIERIVKYPISVPCNYHNIINDFVAI